MGFFKDLGYGIKMMNEANKELVVGVKSDIKEFRTGIKDDIKEYYPRIGKGIEKVDRLTQTTGNLIKAGPYHRDISDVDDLKIADHLSVTGGIRIPGYSHHALYLGDEQVIHYQQDEVRIDSLEDFRREGKIRVVNSVRTYSNDEIILRAYAKKGETNYNLLFNNCEHFINWCRSGGKYTNSI